MADIVRFEKVLDAVERLSPEEQETLVDIVRHRWLTHRRAALAKDIAEARQEFRAGNCPVRTPAELMREISKETSL